MFYPAKYLIQLVLSLSLVPMTPFSAKNSITAGNSLLVAKLLNNQGLLLQVINPTELSEAQAQQFAN